ncbi:MAG: hypothetical protein JXR34_00650 [Bacteroidales bacterium]|nr:hypothetical protein [Bacteroidales bacterium]
MEELLPILIAVVWFIYKMYQGAQKKADRKQRIVKPEQAVPVEKDSEFDMDEMVKTIFGVNNIAPQPNPVFGSQTDSVENEYQQVEQNDNRYKDYIEDDTEAYQSNIQSVEYQHESIQEKVIRQAANLEEEEIEYNNILEDFDVKKAVIYSAILERRYI